MKFTCLEAGLPLITSKHSTTWFQPCLSGSFDQTFPFPHLSILTSIHPIFPSLIRPPRPYLRHPCSYPFTHSSTNPSALLLFLEIIGGVCSQLRSITFLQRTPTLSHRPRWAYQGGFHIHPYSRSQFSFVPPNTLTPHHTCNLTPLRCGPC